MDRFGSRRVWVNSQRGCLILRHPKSYLPTHSVIHKSAIRVLAIFADASRTGYAEAKILVFHASACRRWMQAAQATMQGKSKRLPQGRKYLNALKNRTNGTNYENAKTPRRRRGVLLSGDQIFVTILMPGPMVDAVTQDLMYWPFAAAGLALMIAPMSAL